MARKAQFSADSKRESLATPNTKFYNPNGTYYLNGSLFSKDDKPFGAPKRYVEYELAEYFETMLETFKTDEKLFSILQYANRTGKPKQWPADMAKLYPELTFMYEQVKSICEERLILKGFTRDGFNMAKLILGNNYGYGEAVKNIRTETTHVTVDKKELAKMSIEELNDTISKRLGGLEAGEVK